MTVADKDINAIEQFFGLRNNVRPEAFALGDLDRATNIDIDDARKPRRRKGFASALFAGSHHSIFADSGVMLAGSGTALRRLFSDGTAVTLRSDLSGGRISYAPVGPRIYFTETFVTGCVDGGRSRTWGLEPPSAQPFATLTGGSLRAGTYQFAITYVRSDGQESGTGTAGRAYLVSTGGITFSAIPVSNDPDVTAKYLYISPVNGDAMYRVQTLPAAATTASYFAEVVGTVQITTQFLRPPLAGQFAFTFNGRVYVARGRKLYCTEPFAPELMDVRRSFTMPSHIVAGAAVDDGIWLFTAEEGIFLPGNDPSKFEYRPKVAYGAISGTVAYANAEDLDPAADGLAAIIATKQGITACLNGGTMKNLTKDRYAYPVTDRGAGVVRTHGGMAQYLLVLEGSTTAGNTAF